MSPADLDTYPDAVWYCHVCAFCGSYSETRAHLVAKPTHVLSPLTTKTGRVVTNEEMDRWVEEAERGYDLRAGMEAMTHRLAAAVRSVAVAVHPGMPERVI